MSQFSQEQIDRSFSQMQQEHADLQRVCETLTGQLNNFKVARIELENREAGLLLDLDTWSRPNDESYRKKPIADTAIELGAVRAGLEELGRITRAAAVDLDRKQRRLSDKMLAIEDFKAEYKL